MNRFEWMADEVRRALEDAETVSRGGRGSASPTFERVSTDTRRIRPGDLFVALAGERFDAHDFLDAAAEAGARGAVVSRVPDAAPDGLTYFVVPDTLQALGRLARHRRRHHPALVLGITGTNGKTTTKDLLRSALATGLRVHATEGNLNNQVGVPLTVLAAPDDAEVMIVEMGTNEPGEIGILTAIAEPRLGIITGVGEGHLEKLGSVKGVLREKTSLLTGLPPKGIGFVAEVPPSLPATARDLLGAERVHVAGWGEGVDLHPDGGAEGIEFMADGTTRWRWCGEQLHLPLRGRHNVRNALLALGVAEELGIDPADAVRALETMPAPKLRTEWRNVGSIRVIADCYNANPPSVIAAVDLLATLPTEGAKVLVLGTMLELGGESEALHRRVAEHISGTVGRGIDRVVATGEFVAAFAPDAPVLGERLVSAEDPLNAYEALRASLSGGETILLKGSRGVALERWLPLLERDWG